MSQVGSYVMDYIGFSDERLTKYARGELGRLAADPSLNAQTIEDVKRVIAARENGEAWAWQNTALLSAFDRNGLASFAQQLQSYGWRVLGSTGTVAFLADQGIKATNVAKFVGPPMLGHRVVTLSRELHAALLSTESKDDIAELKSLNVPRVDLVYCSLYPLEDEIADPERSLESVIEKTDIGGPTMLRSAAKGRRLVIHNQLQFPLVTNLISGRYFDEICRLNGGDPKDPKVATAFEKFYKEFVSLLACEVETRCADYSKASSNFLKTQISGDTWKIVSSI